MPQPDRALKGVLDIDLAVPNVQIAVKDLPDRFNNFRLVRERSKRRAVAMGQIDLPHSSAAFALAVHAVGGFGPHENFGDYRVQC